MRNMVQRVKMKPAVSRVRRKVICGVDKVERSSILVPRLRQARAGPPVGAAWDQEQPKGDLSQLPTCLLFTVQSSTHPSYELPFSFQNRLNK